MDELPQPDPRRHWSFQPPVRPRVPAGAAIGHAAGWVRNPIDAFLAAEHRKHGLKPRPAADPATLVAPRLPRPHRTGAEPGDSFAAFVADPSDRAYEALVDRLLASPEYGERWGRHWMDVWRYSDWDGFGAEVRESQPHIWRWRDWIVESLNRDLPYDRMIVAMLAADETDPATPRRSAPPASWSATGTSSIATSGWKTRSSIPPRRSWASRSIARNATITSTTRSRRPTITPSAHSSSPTRFAPTPCPESPTPRRPGWCGSMTGTPPRPRLSSSAGDEKRPIKGKPLAPSIPGCLGKSGRSRGDQFAVAAAGSFLSRHERHSCASRRSNACRRARSAAQKSALAAAERALADAHDRASPPRKPGMPSRLPRRA